MTMSEDMLKQTGQQDWSPNFVDYLFLAFNTSTAFSPTDVPVLARWAKILMMLQSLLSLLIIALLAAAWPNSVTAEEHGAIPIQAETSCMVGHRFEPGPVVGGRNRQPTVREFQARMAQLRKLEQRDAHLGANCQLRTTT